MIKSLISFLIVVLGTFTALKTQQPGGPYMQDPSTVLLMHFDNNQKIKISDDLEIIKISDYSYIHVSYSEIPPFGRVPSNGVIFIDNGKAFLFDTPATDSLTMDLVNWIRNNLKCGIAAFVPNHWHIDCMGGLAYLNSLGIESYAQEMTLQIAESKNLPVPSCGFKDSIILNSGGKEIICSYLGAAHTYDNIVVWIPSERLLFAGCMVKGIKSKGLGNTADGDLKEYPETIKNILSKYKNAKFVIPGHGQFGGIELLRHTLKLSRFDERSQHYELRGERTGQR